MREKAYVLKIALLLSLGLFLLPGSLTASGKKMPLTSPPAEPAQTPCSATTDADIVKAVLANIKSAFTKSELNKFHFNVTCKSGIVKLQGFVIGKATRNKVVDIARKTGCVKSVNKAPFFSFKSGGCPEHMKLCNGACIDENDDCNPPPKG